jgi:branched-chain amino acid transport system substrate-binding protein
MKNLAILLLCLTSTIGSYAEDNRPIVKIGAILPLSGNTATFGESIRNSTTLKAERLNQDPTHRYRYQMLYEDDQGQGRLTAMAFQRLKNLERIQAVISFSAAGVAISPQAEAAGIIHFGIGAAPALSEGKYNFVHWARVEPPCRLMAETLQKLGYKRIAIISQKHHSINAQTEFFKTIAPEYRLTVLCDEKLNPDEKDTRTTLLKVKELQPDILLLNCLTPLGDIALKQMHQLEIDLPISAITCLYALQRSSLQGIWWVDPSIAHQSFYDAYQKRWGKPSEVGAANHYDSVGLIAHAYEQWQGEGLPSADFVARKLMEVKDYTDALGPTTPDENGIFDLPPRLVTVKPDFSGYTTLSLEEVREMAAQHISRAKTDLPKAP